MQHTALVWARTCVFLHICPSKCNLLQMARFEPRLKLKLAAFALPFVVPLLSFAPFSHLLRSPIAIKCVFKWMYSIRPVCRYRLAEVGWCSSYGDSYFHTELNKGCNAVWDNLNHIWFRLKSHLSLWLNICVVFLEWINAFFWSIKWFIWLSFI